MNLSIYEDFFIVGPPKENIFFDPLLWFIFQLSFYTYYKLQSFTCWTSVGSYICIQIQTIQLLIFTEKFWPSPGFEPGTSQVPSRYATNWAILAWIYSSNLSTTKGGRKMAKTLLIDWHPALKSTMKVLDNTSNAIVLF